MMKTTQKDAPKDEQPRKQDHSPVFWEEPGAAQTLLLGTPTPQWLVFLFSNKVPWEQPFQKAALSARVRQVLSCQHQNQGSIGNGALRGVFYFYLKECSFFCDDTFPGWSMLITFFFRETSAAIDLVGCLCIQSSCSINVSGATESEARGHTRNCRLCEALGTFFNQQGSQWYPLATSNGFVLRSREVSLLEMQSISMVL